MAADDGASAHELMAQFGWVKVEQAETYTKKADRKRLGVRSSKRIAEQMQNIMPRTEIQGSGIAPENAVKSTSK